MSWSARLPKEALWASVPLVLGLAFGNPLLVGIGLVPLMYIVLSRSYETPSGIKVEAGETKSRAFVGEQIELTRNVKVEEGSGLVILGEDIDSQLTLEGGNNLRAFWKGKASLETGYAYHLSGRKRGAHSIGPLMVESLHFSGMRTTVTEKLGEGGEVQTVQRPIYLRGIRETPKLARTALPVNANSRVGTRSTDFRELRRYVRGDRFRDINWKATVRLAASEDMPPLVNEYEKEGRRTVWVFLDSGTAMKAGTSADSAFECGVTAASAICRFFIERDCEVGLGLVGVDQAVFPSTGRRHGLMIERALQKSDVDARGGGLLSTVNALERHITGSNPLVVIVTRITGEDAEDIRQGMERLRKIGGMGTSLSVLDIDPFGKVARDEDDELARGLVDLATRPAVARIASVGAAIVRWDAAAQPFGSAAYRLLARR